jgi:FkbM family methyltransferase
MIKTLKKIKYFFEGKYISVNINKISKQWFGNQYGGFYLAQNSIDKSSIVYSVGIGEDISFDEGIMDRYGCKVFAFDPTPKSVVWVKENVTTQNFVFSPIGVAKEKGSRKFYLPTNNNHVSGSIHDIKTINNSNSINLRFDSLSNIMKDNNHLKLDLLKMDIEGAEYEVIDHIQKNNIDIKQVLVEFHPHFEKDGKKKTKKAIEKLEKMGYRCFGLSNSLLEYSFIK